MFETLKWDTEVRLTAVIDEPQARERAIAESAPGEVVLGEARELDGQVSRSATV